MNTSSDFKTGCGIKNNQWKEGFQPTFSQEQKSSLLAVTSSNNNRVLGPKHQYCTSLIQESSQQTVCSKSQLVQLKYRSPSCNSNNQCWIQSEKFTLSWSQHQKITFLLLAQEEYFSLLCLQKTETMEFQESRQAMMPQSSRHSRQRGNGLGSNALSVWRVTLPFAEKVLLFAVEVVAKGLFVQSLPELKEVATKKKSFRQAATSASKKTVKYQIGGGGRRKLHRSRSIFFSENKNVT